MAHESPEMLTERRASLLNLIVDEYVDTAVPVGSQYIVRKHAMAVSPATVRIEMARLEEEGYINQPHTSAGRVPSDKGYRYYVESLMTEERLSWEEAQTIRHQFHQAERDLEQWFQLAAAVLAHAVSNFAVVTSPRSRETRLRHVQIVPLQELSALVVVVLNEARIRQQVIAFREPVDQYALARAASSFNERAGGLLTSEVRLLTEAASELEAVVQRAVVELMDQEEVAQTFQKYHMASAPVVDEAGRLTGMVTVDDIVDVISEESEEDLLKLAGVSEAAQTDSVFRSVRARAPWLLVNLGTAVVASAVISAFQGSIAELVALAVLRFRRRPRPGPAQPGTT